LREEHHPSLCFSAFVAKSSHENTKAKAAT